MDRLTMVTELGLLAKDATLRGDDRAVGVLTAVAGHLMDIHGELSGLERRRSAAADKKRRQRHPVPGTGEDTPGHPGTKSGFPSDSPSQKETLPRRHHTAREAVDGAAAQNVEMVATLSRLLSKDTGPLWSDVDAFLKRRSYSTWEGWLKEMRTLTTSSSYTVEDLANACRDDLALERPLASPKALRSFLESARQDRLHPAGPTSSGHRNGTQSKQERGRQNLADAIARRAKEANNGD